jgi:hypothetical protein
VFGRDCKPNGAQSGSALPDKEAGRDTAKRFGVAYDWNRLVSDPVYNTQMGAAEAGRGRVEQWAAQHGDPRDPEVDAVDWVERIPFAERKSRDPLASPADDCRRRGTWVLQAYSTKREVWPASVPSAATSGQELPSPTLAADKSVATVEAAAETRGDMTNVTLFQTVQVQFSNGRSYGVVTGTAYANSRAGSSPIRQWCYLQAGSVSAATQITVTLATKEGGTAGSVELAKLEDADAKAVGLPLKSIQQSVASCRFI